MTRAFIKGGKVVERKVRDSRILVPLGSSNARIDSLYTLNGTAGRVWDLALSGLTDDDIVARMIGEYSVDEVTARRDAAEILDQLLAMGALTVAPAGQ